MKGIGNKEIFAKNLRYYTELSGKTQTQLAQIVGVAQQTFNDWATAKKYPRIDKIEILANFFGIQKSDLIEEKDVEKEKPASNDGLTESQRELIAFAKTLSEVQAHKVLQLMKSIVAFDE